MYKTKF